jgi:hypothetical protein
MAAALCAALADRHAALAQAIALRAAAWMLQAAATLPADGRASYLRHAPASRALPPAARARLLAVRG